MSENSGAFVMKVLNTLDISAGQQLAAIYEKLGAGTEPKDAEAIKRIFRCLEIDGLAVRGGAYRHLTRLGEAKLIEVGLRKEHSPLKLGIGVTVPFSMLEKIRQRNDPQTLVGTVKENAFRFVETAVNARIVEIIEGALANG